VLRGDVQEFSIWGNRIREMVSTRKKALIDAGVSKFVITGIAQALVGATSVTVQLTRSDSAECFSMTLSEIRKQEPDFFKAK
jgi:hypothetical protein